MRVYIRQSFASRSVNCSWIEKPDCINIEHPYHETDRILSTLRAAMRQFMVCVGCGRTLYIDYNNDMRHQDTSSKVPIESVCDQIDYSNPFPPPIDGEDEGEVVWVEIPPVVDPGDTPDDLFPHSPEWFEMVGRALMESQHPFKWDGNRWR